MQPGSEDCVPNLDICHLFQQMYVEDEVGVNSRLLHGVKGQGFQQSEQQTEGALSAGHELEQGESDTLRVSTYAIVYGHLELRKIKILVVVRIEDVGKTTGTGTISIVTREEFGEEGQSQALGTQ